MRIKNDLVSHTILTLAWAAIPWGLLWFLSEVSTLDRKGTVALVGILTMALWSVGVVFYSTMVWAYNQGDLRFRETLFKPYMKEGEAPFDTFLRTRGDLEALLRLYERALLEKEELSKKLSDAKKTGLDPEMGFLLDGATLGEWAAYDYAVASHCAAVNNILDGKDTGAGACNEPWASVRLRLLNLVSIAEAVPEGGTAADLRNLRRANDKMATGVQHLRELVGVMSNCYISSWQTVHWHSELEKAQAFLKELDDV